jgi:hypothetical protein
MRPLLLSLCAGMLAISLPLGAAGARASPIVEAAIEAERLLEAGESLDALERLDDAVGIVWQASPLLFPMPVIVEGAEGYGIYTPRTNAGIRPGEPLRVYVEPIGYGYGGETETHIGLDVDLAIEHVGGLVLAEAHDLFDVTVASRNRIREFHIVLSFTMPELQAGNYRAVFTVRDRHSDKSGEFSVDFTIGDDP